MGHPICMLPRASQLMAQLYRWPAAPTSSTGHRRLSWWQQGAVDPCALGLTNLMSVTRRLTLSRCALHAFTSSRISCDVCRQLLYLRTM